MKAVILAGGKGSRLGSVAVDIPKPMVEIGGVPALEHQIRLLKKHTIVDIIILTGHLADSIEAYFGDGSRFGVKITYFCEPVPLGTTGGIKEVEELLSSDFLVLYGDVFVNMDLSRLIAYHRSKRSDCTLVLHPNDHPYDSDLVEIHADGKVLAFYAKPHKAGDWHHNMVNAALYVLSPHVLNFIEKGVKADFGRDLFPVLCRQLSMYGYATPEYLKDFGTPERFAQVEHDFISGRIALRSLACQRGAVFLDRDGVINVEKDLLCRVDDFELLPGVCEAIKKLNASDYLVIVVTNQPVVARNLCSIETVDEIHKKMETLLGQEHAKLDAIFYCPHHPDKGYPEENPQFKVDCDCRKPKTGMIERAQKQFNINLEKSFIIGDSERDILCGENAGLTTVGVRTGYGCRASSVEPDHMFRDLKEAADFIVSDLPCP